jgi:hypothetical protein
LEDRIEALEALHEGDGEDLHFRFLGKAAGRCFAVNVQFDSADDRTAETLRPEEYDFMMIKVLRLVLAHIRDTPNPALN